MFILCFLRFLNGGVLPLRFQNHIHGTKVEVKYIGTMYPWLHGSISFSNISIQV